MSSLLFIDSVRHYATANGGRKYQGFDATVTAAAGRTGGPAIVLDGPGTLSKTLGPEYATLTAGFAIKFGTFGSSGRVFFRFRNQGPINPNMRIELTTAGDGRVYFHLTGVGDYDGPLSTFKFTLNQWYYVEVQCAISIGGGNTTVSYELRVNGATILGPSTLVAATTTSPDKWAQFEWVSLGGSPSLTLCDIYCTDTEFLGDVSLVYLLPILDGPSGAWTPLSAGAHYLMVNATDPPDNAAYVETAVVNNVDNYKLTQIVGSPTILGAQAIACLDKSDPGVGSTKISYFDGTATTVLASEFFPSADNFIYALDAQRKSVFSAANWTAAEINAMRLGIKRVS